MSDVVTIVAGIAVTITGAATAISLRTALHQRYHRQRTS